VSARDTKGRTTFRKYIARRLVLARAFVTRSYYLGQLPGWKLRFPTDHEDRGPEDLALRRDILAIECADGQAFQYNDEDQHHHERNYHNHIVDFHNQHHNENKYHKLLDDDNDDVNLNIHVDNDDIHLNIGIKSKAGSLVDLDCKVPQLSKRVAVVAAERCQKNDTCPREEGSTSKGRHPHGRKKGTMLCYF